MEAAVLIGLIGLGQLINNDKDENTPVINTIHDDINTSNGDNIYNSNYYKETNEVINELAEDNFNDSFIEGSQVINSKKVKKDNPFLNNAFNKEGFTGNIYSSISGENIDENDFLRNDQGISAQPFFKKEPVVVDLDDRRQLDRHQGDNQYSKSKVETPPFFNWEKNNNVFGNKFGEYIGDKSRYIEGKNRNNELPFEQVKVSHIDTKSDINRDIKQIIADKTNVDVTRSLSKPKLSYEGRVISGKGTNEKRGNIGSVNKYDPETYYENNEDRYFKTTGAYLNQSERPVQLIKDTYRTTLNDQPLGIVSSSYPRGEKRSKYQKPLKLQLGSDTTRNIAGNEYASSAEFTRKGYRNVPNEREVTSQRTHKSNLRTEVNNQTTRIMDDLKKTVKETTLDSKNNGNINNTVIQNKMGLLDTARVTKKQTTIDSKNNGYITGGYNKLTSGFESPETTIRDSTLYEYTGNAGSSGFKRDMSKYNYQNAETNANKELISKGREPTLNNTKVVNGAEHHNIYINKLESDYINVRRDNPNKVYQTGPRGEQYELTTMKDKLNDSSISARIDKELLDPFRNNPYTQPLSSY